MTFESCGWHWAFGMAFGVWDDIGELGMTHVVWDDTEGCCDCGTKSTRKIIILKIFCFFLIFFAEKSSFCEYIF